MRRIGTCGGIGLPPGTVVVTEEAVDGRVRPVLDTVGGSYFELYTDFLFNQIILGKVVSRKSKLDLGLAKNLVATGQEEDKFQTVLGKTISTDDFYEGQVSSYLVDTGSMSCDTRAVLMEQSVNTRRATRWRTCRRWLQRG